MKFIKPALTTGGSYFIKSTIENEPIYIQPPKCNAKQALTKTGKRYYCDLMFNNDEEEFVQWVEKLEALCRSVIYQNKDEWFESDMTDEDIENYFTPSLKIFKSGKFYIARTNITLVMGKTSVKVYDENGVEFDMDTIVENTKMMTVLEVQGIRCSTRSFNIDFELKQVMILKENSLFDRCVISSKKKTESSLAEMQNGKVIIVEEKAVSPVNVEERVVHDSSLEEQVVDPVNVAVHDSSLEEQVVDPVHESGLEEQVVDPVNVAVHDSGLEEQVVDPVHESGLEEQVVDPVNVAVHESGLEEKVYDPVVDKNGLDEIELHLEDSEDVVTLKKRDEVYYELYVKAKTKAKEDRNVALASYLEAKRIKNVYLLDDLTSDSEEEVDN